MVDTLDTPDFTMDTPDTDTLVLDIMAKGPLTPSPRLMLMPTTLMDMVDMVLDMLTVDTLPLDTLDFTTDWDTLDSDMEDIEDIMVMARGPLMPSPRLMPMPTTLMDILDMVDTTLDTPDFTTA